MTPLYFKINSFACSPSSKAEGTVAQHFSHAWVWSSSCCRNPVTFPGIILPLTNALDIVLPGASTPLDIVLVHLFPIALAHGTIYPLTCSPHTVVQGTHAVSNARYVIWEALVLEGAGAPSKCRRPSAFSPLILLPQAQYSAVHFSCGIEQDWKMFM